MAAAATAPSAERELDQASRWRRSRQSPRRLSLAAGVCCACLAAARACFMASFASRGAVRQGAPTPRVRLRAATSADADLGKGDFNWFKEVFGVLKEKSVREALMLTAEDAKEMRKRVKMGNMNFVDFLNVVYLLNMLGGDRGLVDKIATESTGDSRGVVGKLEKYKQVLDAMTPEERSEPELFTGREASVRSLIVMERGRLPEGAVQEFVQEYNVMKALLTTAGEGYDIEEMAKQGILASKANFATRRKMNKVLGNKKVKNYQKKNIRKSKRPEWMDL